MNTRNLMPPARVAAKRRAKATRRWVVLDGSYLAVLAVAGALYAWHCVTPATPDEAATAAGIAKAESQLAQLRGQTASIDAQLKTAQELSARPDWSALLITLSKAVGDDVVLDTIECGDATTGNAGSAAAPRKLTLSGTGRSQPAVTAFVLRAEAIGAFDRVQLVQSQPQTLRGHAGVGFRVVCTLPDWPGGAS